MSDEGWKNKKKIIKVPKGTVIIRGKSYSDSIRLSDNATRTGKVPVYAIYFRKPKSRRSRTRR